MSLMNIDVKIPSEILENQIQEHIKRIIHQGQLRFVPGIQGWLQNCKIINAIDHINRMDEKINVIMSIYGEKASDKIQHTVNKNS